MNRNTRLDDKLNALLVAVAIALAVGLDVDVLGGAPLDRGAPATTLARAEAPAAAATTALVAAVEAGPLLH